MQKLLKKIISLFLISFYFLKAEQVQSIIPYYYFPTIKNLEKLNQPTFFGRIIAL